MNQGLLHGAYNDLKHSMEEIERVRRVKGDEDASQLYFTIMEQSKERREDD